MAMITYIGPEPLKTLTPLLPPPPRKLSPSPRHGSANASPPSIASLAFISDQHLEIIAALKGRPVDQEARSAVVESIRQLDRRRVAALMDFLESPQGVIASTLENNACRRFHCATDALERALAVEANIYALLDLWDTVLRQVVPTLGVMLYPLEKIGFRAAPTIYRYFRDRVILRVLCDDATVVDPSCYDRTTARRVASMLARLRLETPDDDNGEALDAINARFLSIASASRARRKTGDDSRSRAESEIYMAKRKNGIFARPMDVPIFPTNARNFYRQDTTDTVDESDDALRYTSPSSSSHNRRFRWRIDDSEDRESPTTEDVSDKFEATSSSRPAQMDDDSTDEWEDSQLAGSRLDSRFTTASSLFDESDGGTAGRRCFQSLSQLRNEIMDTVNRDKREERPKITVDDVTDKCDIVEVVHCSVRVKSDGRDDISAQERYSNYIGPTGTSNSALAAKEPGYGSPIGESSKNEATVTNYSEYLRHRRSLAASDAYGHSLYAADERPSAMPESWSSTALASWRQNVNDTMTQQPAARQRRTCERASSAEGTPKVNAEADAPTTPLTKTMLLQRPGKSRSRTMPSKTVRWEDETNGH